MVFSPYARLGLPEKAGLDAAKAAFRKLAKTCHPDIAGGDPNSRARFEEITFALKDIEAEHGHRAIAQKQARPAASQAPHSRPVQLLITVEEAVKGTLRRIEYAQGSVCIVRIPAGVEQGTVLKVPGLGPRSDAQSRASDLLIAIEFSEDPLYRVQGGDVFMLMEVSPSLLASGGVVELPSPHGPINVTVEAGTRPGQVLRLPGRGLPARGGRADGALYVTLKLGERTRARQTVGGRFTRFWPQPRPAA
jgi:DnaJ-class molecular chaperone